MEIVQSEEREGLEVVEECESWKKMSYDFRSNVSIKAKVDELRFENGQVG